MQMITGEVRKVLDDEYKNKNGNLVKQAIVVIEPIIGRQNYEIYLSRSQVDSGMVDTWLKLIGKQASVSVTMFVNYEYRFQKFNALGNGQPLKAFTG